MEMVANRDRIRLDGLAEIIVAGIFLLLFGPDQYTPSCICPPFSYSNARNPGVSGWAASQAKKP
jgi:hypothetical protein